MKLVIATTNTPHEMPEAYKTLDGAISEYEKMGFVIVDNLNTQMDWSRGGVRMERTHPLCATIVATIVTVEMKEK